MRTELKSELRIEHGHHPWTIFKVEFGSKTKMDIFILGTVVASGVSKGDRFLSNDVMFHFHYESLGMEPLTVHNL